MSLMSRLSGHVCPNCGAEPGWFALHATFRGGAKRTRYNEFAACPGCEAHLVLSTRPDGPGLLVWQGLLPLLVAALFIGGMVVSLSFVSPDGGLTPAAVAMFSFTAVFAVLIMLIRARLERHFFQVEVL